MLTIEHGPEGNKLNVDYTSVGLFYSDSPQFENKHLFDVTDEVQRRDILLAQDMTMRLYWFTQASFDGSSMIISSNEKNIGLPILILRLYLWYNSILQEWIMVNIKYMLFIQV